MAKIDAQGPLSATPCTSPSTVRYMPESWWRARVTARVTARVRARATVRVRVTVTARVGVEGRMGVRVRARVMWQRP